MACYYSDSNLDFVDKVKSDISIFLKNKSEKSVLVFPPVNSYCRFLIHQLVQDIYNHLKTFSIGEEPERRIVVCTDDIVSSVESQNNEINLPLKGSEQETHPIMVQNNEGNNQSQVRKQRSALPTVNIYRPPAARRSLEKSSEPPVVSHPENVIPTETPKETRSRVRRPDIQVYVPRAKRLHTEQSKIVEKSPTIVDDSKPCQKIQSKLPYDAVVPKESHHQSSELILDITKKPPKKNFSSSSRPTTVNFLPPRASQLVETKKKLCQSTSLSDLESETDEANSDSRTRLPISAMAPERHHSSTHGLRNRSAALVENMKQLCQSDFVPWRVDDEDNHVDRKPCDIPAGSSKNISKPPENGDIFDVMYKKFLDSCNGITDNSTQSVIASEVTDNSNTSEITVSSQKFDNGEISTCAEDSELSDDEFHDADSKDSSSSKLSDKCDDNNESQSSGDSSNSPTAQVQLMKPIEIDVTKKRSVKSTRTFNPDECDWESLLDDDGEVLDSYLMKELTSAVGQVRVSQPQSDYRSYRSQAPADSTRPRRHASDEDFGHVLEIYNFPKEFKTNDLVAVFLPFKNAGGGFEIKWVDDTHALGVFPSTIVAEQVLEYDHPMVRTRPLSEASLDSRLKARRLADSIQSFRPRPETCAALARRLVTGALGVKLATARQEREEEKRVLHEAREKRRLAAKQRDDIWNSG